MLTAIEQECADRRAAIIAQAKLLCTQGGHYLWGAQGQKPAPSGPVILANPILDSANLANTQFCAATLNGNVCAGRFRAHDVWLQLPVQKIWNTLTDDVSKFVKANAANPGAQVGWTGGLTPRCILGYTNNDAQGSPTDYEGGGSLLNKVVWARNFCQPMCCASKGMSHLFWTAARPMQSARHTRWSMPKAQYTA
jgi:hypothetical protein